MAPYILSVRPLPDSELDCDTLARRGVPALAAPLLEPHLIAPTLPHDPSLYAGLIFTSRHAVDGFLAALGNGGPGGWAALPVFAVGPATARVAGMAGFSVKVTGHGGGGGLAPLIHEHVNAGGLPLLWPAARDRGFDMVAALAPAITVEDIAVYAMERTLRLTDAALDALAYGKILAVKLMSARSAHLFWHDLGRAY